MNLRNERRGCDYLGENGAHVTSLWERGKLKKEMQTICSSLVVLIFSIPGRVEKIKDNLKISGENKNIPQQKIENKR